MSTLLTTTATALGAQPAHAEALVQACERFGISTPVQQAVFLGQLHVESMGFRRSVESLDYAADKLQGVFGKRITRHEAQMYGRIDAKVRMRTRWEHPDQRANQEAIANCVYGGEWGRRNLGNTLAGDGWRFRGRGDIQLTGRTNYRQFSLFTFQDLRLLDTPDMVAQLPYRSLAAGWFWSSRECGKLITGNLAQSVEAVTRRINGGMHAYDARLAQAKRALYLLQETP